MGIGCKVTVQDRHVQMKNTVYSLGHFYGYPVTSSQTSAIASDSASVFFGVTVTQRLPVTKNGYLAGLAPRLAGVIPLPRRGRKATALHPIRRIRRHVESGKNSSCAGKNRMWGCYEEVLPAGHCGAYRRAIAERARADVRITRNRPGQAE